VYGELDLPSEIVSSEYLTMEGKKFSTSRQVVIYVHDMLDRYQADAFRYYVCAAGPETSDSDFTWAEFVARTNNELVAGWGNLVNRTASMINKNFGEIPAPGDLTDADQAVLAAVRGGFETVGRFVEEHRLRAGIGEAMRIVGEVNKYLSDEAPWKLKDEADRPRLATILWVAAQCVVDVNTLLSPFLPASANAVHSALGGVGTFMPMPVIEEVTDLDDGTPYLVITGDYSSTPAWARRDLAPGTPVAKPTPVFTKLDPAVVDEELARLEA
jgi:methionyl-tRNA synthetase